MKPAINTQPRAQTSTAPGEIIVLPPLQVRKATPSARRWLNAALQRLLPPLLGLALLLLGWQLAAIGAKGFPTPLSTLDSALTLFSDPFYRDGPNDMGIGWNVLASLQRVAVGFGLAALAGIPLGFLIGRSLFFARMFNPLIALLRPVSPLAWLPIGLLLFQKAEPASSWTIFICSIWPMVINTAEGVRRIPQDYLNVARVLQLSEWTVMRKILFPAVLPAVLTGVRLSIGIAWLVIVAAEMLTGGLGIGFWIWNEWNNLNVENIIIAIVTMTTGSALLMWIGEQITEKGVGNGISIVLLFNILSSVPDDMKTLYYRFIFGQTVTKMIFSVVVIALIILAMVVFVIVLNDAERRIPVQYSKKMVGRKMVGGQASNIPLKINTAGVMPVIFASSIMSFPVVISQFFTIDPNSIGSKILMVLNSGSWCRPEYPIYSIGLVIYIALLIMFAYFYTSITFNPLEGANNMKKQGGFIPGIRPGKPTSDYLNKILNYIVFIGACGLIVIAIVPILASGLLNVSRISFSGTSLIIIVGVVLETIKAVESQMLVRYYKGFLND